MKIPKEVSDKLDTLYPGKYKDVRYCLGLIIVNLLKFDEIAYSRNKNFYTKNRTSYYTFANMLNAIDLAVKDDYAVKSQRGYQTFGYDKVDRRLLNPDCDLIFLTTPKM